MAQYTKNTRRVVCLLHCSITYVIKKIMRDVVTNARVTAHVKQIIDAEDGAASSLLQYCFDHDRTYCRIGRNTDNDVRLDNSLLPLHASRYHAILIRNSVNGHQVYTLRDMESTNGTYIGDELIPCGEQRQLHHGAVLSFGGCEYVANGDAVQINPYRFVFYECDASPTTLETARNRKRKRVTIEKGAIIHDEVREELRCAICMNDVVDAHILCCSHSFCGACIFRWYDLRRERKSCPVCRTPMAREPTRNVPLNTLMHATIARDMSQSERNAWEKRLADSVSVRQMRTLDKETEPLSVAGGFLSVLGFR